MVQHHSFGCAQDLAAWILSPIILIVCLPTTSQSHCRLICLVFPATILADVEGGRGTVDLETVGAGKGRASWIDGAVPRTVEFDITDAESLPDLPKRPGVIADVGADFLTVLAEASQTAAKDSARFALTHIQLRGKRGQVVGTDGRQLLVQSGYRLPWSEDVLIPALPVYGCREFHVGPCVQVGRTETHVMVRDGPWTLFLAIDTKLRYPDVDVVIPKRNANTRVHLSEKDAQFLLAALPKLPGTDDNLQPVTLDLGEQVVVRARGQSSPQVSELVLAGSRTMGPALRAAMDRRYLSRLIRLGFP